MNRLGLLLVVAASSVTLTAQQAAPAFEVVSIKRSPPDALPGRAGLMPGGRYVLSNGPIRVLIGIAFPRPTNESTTMVFGSTTPGPGWKCSEGGRVLPETPCLSYTYPAP